MKNTKRIIRCVIVGLLLLIFARLALDARQLSLTTDEPFHIASGYAYLAQGATWTTPMRGHPLLVDAWSALPFFVGMPDIPVETLSGWESDHIAYVKAFTSYISEGVERNEVASRVPVMLLTLLLASTITRWAGDLWGMPGAILALSILAFDPLVLGHGMLATNDVGVTALGTLALFLTHRLGQRGASARNLTVTGVAYGLTMLAKSSGVIWIAGGLIMLLSMNLRRSSLKNTLKDGAIWGAVILGVALLTIWAFYGFEFGPGQVLPVGIPAPTHWESILMQAESPETRSVYYLGRVEDQGWWFYFPLAFMLKNPLPLLMMLGWTFLEALHSTVSPFKGCGHNRAIWAFPLLYTTVAIGSGLNIGYRHLLPVHPFLYMGIGGLVTVRPRTRGSLVGLVIWLALESILIAPHHIAYFNQLAGGPDRGWRYLADSNTDWGQAHKVLRDYQETTGRSFRYAGKSVYLGYATYGVVADPLPPLFESYSPVMKPWIYPEPGYYVLSANSLAGLGCTEPDNYAWFRNREPEKILGHVLFVYKVPPLPKSTWVAQCTNPTTPLSDGTIGEAFPMQTDRKIAFDCLQSWIIPRHAGIGWYVLHDELIDRETETRQRLGLSPIQPNSRFTAARVASLDLTYRQWNYRRNPAYAVYMRDPSALSDTPAITRGIVGMAHTPPKGLPNPTESPITLAGPLKYLGAELQSHSNGLDVATWWEVNGQPPTSSPSVMAHLVTEEGETLGIADGLGVGVENWRSGDIVIQRHRFELTNEPVSTSSELWLRTGIYWSDTGKRWTAGEKEGDAIFVRLSDR